MNVGSVFEKKTVKILKGTVNMAKIYRVEVDGEIIAEVAADRTMSLYEVMYCAGYDINSDDDCKEAYDRGVKGFRYDKMADFYYFLDRVADFYVRR